MAIKTERPDPNALDDKQRQLLSALSVVADVKRRLGLLYGDACLGAPTLEASVALTAMAQDELGHSRVLGGLARGVDELEAGEHAGHGSPAADVPEPLKSSSGDWLDVLAAALTADLAATLVLQAGMAGSYAPLRARGAKILDEEAFHQLYAAGWAQQMAADEARRRALVVRLHQWMPAVEGWLAAVAARCEGLDGILMPPSPQDLRAAVQAKAAGVV